MCGKFHTPLGNVGSQGNYFPPKMQFQPRTPKFKEKGHKLAVLKLSPFCSASPVIIAVKVYHRQTDRQIL